MREKIQGFLIGVLLAVCGVAGAQLLPYFGPVTGILYGTAGDPQTSVATLAQFESALSQSPGLVLGSATGGGQGAGSLNATAVYVNGVAVGGSISPANPTGEVCSSVVDGVATTYMRSDAAPPLNETCNYTLTGAVNLSPSSGTDAVNGVASSLAYKVASGSSSSTDIGDLAITRAGSTANEACEGPNLYLDDTTNSKTLCLQLSGDQIELWHDGTQDAYWNSSHQLATTVAPGQAANGVGYQGTPTNSQSSNYTVAASDNGKTIEFTSSSGETVTIPCDELPGGFVVTIINSYGNTAVTITSSEGSLYWAIGAGNTTGNRTLTGQGIATIYVSGFLAGCEISGSGLS